MAPRANWKGYLKVAELACPVALYTAASSNDRIAFHTINRTTGNRVKRQYVDSETGKPVEAEDQVKGYEVGSGEFIVLEPEEVASVVPESDKTLSVESFVPFDEIDTVYFDRPYYLAPSDPTGEEVFALIRDGMKEKKEAALARAVLFRRVRTVLIQPEGAGLIGMTLNFDYEVRPAQEAFGGLKDISIKGEMLDLARHIIDTKRGDFDPREFDDRYDQALAELIKAKLEGRPIELPKPPKEAKVVNLMDALRQSAKDGGKASKKAPAPKRRKAASGQRRKAG